MRLILLFLLSFNAHAFTTLVNQYDFLTIGNVRVNNNIWNSPSGTQHVLVNSDASWVVSSTSFNKPTNGAPGSYPNSQIGCHWGACTPNNPLPRKVNTITSALTYWYTSGLTATGTWNKSLDIWFNTSPTTSTAANGQELMIWDNRKGPIQPIGSLVATKVIGKNTWQVWHGGIVTSYVKIDSGAVTLFNIRMFMDDAILRGYINPNWYLITVQAGFEIWTGGAGLSTTYFSNGIQ